MPNLSHLQIRNPKDDETPVEAATQIFASLLPTHIPLWKRLMSPPKIYGFEIYFLSQMLYFYITTPTEHETFMQSLMASSYPQSKVQKTTDPMDIMLKPANIEVGELKLNSYYYYPIKTYIDFGKIDPLSAVIGYLTKQDAQIRAAIQILVTPTGFPWQTEALKSTQKAEKYNALTGKYEAAAPQESNKALVTKKASFQGGRVAVRLMVASPSATLPLLPYLQNLAGTFGGFSLAEGNQFHFKKPLFNKTALVNRMKLRTFKYFEHTKQILNSQELATMWHPPGMALAGIKNMAWGKTLKGEPPENLPIIKENMAEEEKKDINFFAKTEFKNKETIFGVSAKDRGKHIYIMGKTGAGKSTLIANMAIDDIRKDRGIGIIDPHGDLCETVVDYIPKRRLNDVVYLEPFDTERPFSLNVLETKDPQHRHLIASGIVSIFSKLYAASWGPRLEYVLRNVVLTLLELPDATLADVLPLLAHQSFRERAIEKITDPVIRDFWVKEFAKYPPKMQAEVVSPIQNKVGQFVTTKMIRNIIGHPKSSISLETIMDEGKILLLNLSQGKLGEDNASLLGAMIITQIQLAAMRRAFKKEEDRRPFFLYVDEFQNFATSSFLKILSEARKYRLSLTLANQYIDQLEEDIQRAIFGNVGTLMTFFVGARDAQVLSKEFAGLYSDADLVSLGKHEIIIKLSIDFATSFPFPAKTLPLPKLVNQNKEKIIRVSKEKYGRKVKDEVMIPAEINPQREQDEMPADAQKDKPSNNPPKHNQGGKPGQKYDTRPPKQNSQPPRDNASKPAPQHQQPQQSQSQPKKTENAPPPSKAAPIQQNQQRQNTGSLPPKQEQRNYETQPSKQVVQTPKHDTPKPPQQQSQQRPPRDDNRHQQNQVKNTLPPQRHNQQQKPFTQPHNGGKPASAPQSKDNFTPIAQGAKDSPLKGSIQFSQGQRQVPPRPVLNQPQQSTQNPKPKEIGK